MKYTIEKNGQRFRVLKDGVFQLSFNNYEQARLWILIKFQAGDTLSGYGVAS